MKERDLEAIYAYLKTVPAIWHKVDVFVPLSWKG